MTKEIRCVSDYSSEAGGTWEAGKVEHVSDALAEYLLRDSPSSFRVVDPHDDHDAADAYDARARALVAAPAPEVAARVAALDDRDLLLAVATVDSRDLVRDAVTDRLEELGAPGRHATTPPPAASPPGATARAEDLAALLEGNVTQVREKVAAVDDVDLLRVALEADERGGVRKALEARLAQLLAREAGG